MKDEKDLAAILPNLVGRLLVDTDGKGVIVLILDDGKFVGFSAAHGQEVVDSLAVLTCELVGMLAGSEPRVVAKSMAASHGSKPSLH